MAEPLRRLLVVTTVPATFAFLTPYADHLRSRGWVVDAATGPGDASSWEPHVDRLARVRWSRRPLHPANVLLAGRQVRQVMAEGRYQIVHTHTPVASFITRLAARTLRPRPRVVYTAHGFHFHEQGGSLPNLGFRAAEVLAAAWTDRLVVINEEDRAAAARLRTLPAEALRLFPGIGLDLEHYRADPELLAAAERLRRGLGLDASARLLSVIAELIPRKDHSTALRALATNADPSLHLAVAGDGPLQPALERLATTLGIRERVHFLGLVRDVRPLVLASRATVLPSRREGLSRAVLESLALGRPVIGARSRGVADLLLDGGGLLVEPGDVAGFATAYDAVESQDVGTAWAAEQRRRLRPYSIENLLHLHEDLYDELLPPR